MLFDATELPSMSYAGVFHVRTSASLVNDLASRVRDLGSGRKLPGSLASFDPPTSSWRTSQACLVQALEASRPAETLDEFSGTWPRSGTMLCGTAYPLRPLAPLTGVTVCGWLPTPEASNTKAIARRSGGREPRNFLLPTPSAVNYGSNQGGAAGRVGKIRPSLETMARKDLWPTPRASPNENRQLKPTPSQLAGTHGRSPAAAVNLATPAARDYRHPNKKAFTERGGGTRGEQLPNQIGGPLNPTWVEWLQGFPLGWTEVD